MISETVESASCGLPSECTSATKQDEGERTSILAVVGGANANEEDAAVGQAMRALKAAIDKKMATRNANPPVAEPSSCAEDDKAVEGDRFFDWEGYWGRCPECHAPCKCYSVGRLQYGACMDHRVCWFIGSDAFSCWRRLTPEEHRHNHARLSCCERVEPFYYRNAQEVLDDPLRVANKAAWACHNSPETPELDGRCATIDCG
jgi:hypothetical protein